MLSLHPVTPKVSTNTHYGGSILDMRNQVAFAEPEAGNAGSQRCEGTIVPTIPLRIGEIPSSAYNADVH